jgi:hypothetical protein
MDESNFSSLPSSFSVTSRSATFQRQKSIQQTTHDLLLEASRRIIIIIIIIIILRLAIAIVEQK